MAYFVFEVTELKVVSVVIEADSNESAYERLYDIDNTSDIISTAIASAHTFDSETHCFGEVSEDTNSNVFISDSDYKRIMGEYY